MDTTKNTHRAGTASAILLGSFLALTPVAAHASQTGTAETMIPTGPDIELSATENLRQPIQGDRAKVAPPRSADKTLRQVMEEERRPGAALRPADTQSPQLTEEDRVPEVSAEAPYPTVRPLPKGDRG